MTGDSSPGPAKPPASAPYDDRQDVERAVAVLAERLPEPLLPLARLVYNYRWVWLPDGPRVFRDIHPLLWRRSECNPLYLIAAVATRRLRELARDESYVARVRALDEVLQRDLSAPPATTVPADRPIAYFCSEFAVHCSLPLYGGGLGVLAGDLLKAASDLRVPMVGVGLLYRQGYLHQRMDVWGWQHEYWSTTHFELMPVVRVSAADGHPLTIPCCIRGRDVGIKVWRVDVGRVPLFLLDTDREANDPIDRWITSRLYVGDGHTRLAQYAVLGIGGVRALRALGIDPSLVHLNEGHAVFGSLERLRPSLAAGRTLDDALTVVRERTVFTTHTPVAAGNEAYAAADVEPILGAFVDELGIPRQAVYGLGRVRPADPQEPVSTTALALRTSRVTNGVSRRHGEVARSMWRAVWPDRTLEALPIRHVTNGVHLGTWMANAMQELLDSWLEPGWRDRASDPRVWAAIDAIPDAELWRVRCELRRALVAHVRERSIRDRLGRGESPQYVEAAARCFDPEALTIGFARRMATYKRFYLLTRDPGRSLALLGRQSTPIQLVVAGKAHPQDQEAKDALHALFQIKSAPEVGARVAFLEDYDMHQAPRIVSGVDLWLNLPRPPQEASGTSGMKVALNGGLNLSVLDGWWIEGFDGANGWGIASPDSAPAEQDAHDTAAVFDLLEREVIPLFYERDDDGIPRRWLSRVKRAMRSLIPRFSAQRMLGEYAEMIYRDGSRG
jgi:starch phosphorylase